MTMEGPMGRSSCHFGHRSKIVFLSLIFELQMFVGLLLGPPFSKRKKYIIIFFRNIQVEISFCETIFGREPSDRHGEHAGAARVRRERKMRSFWRHEQMAIQMVLASVQHHSHGVLLNQRTATRTGGRGTRSTTRPSSWSASLPGGPASTSA